MVIQIVPGNGELQVQTTIDVSIDDKRTTETSHMIARPFSGDRP